MRRYIVILCFVLLAIVVVSAASASDVSSDSRSRPARPQRTKLPRATNTPIVVATATPAYSPTPLATATPNDQGPLREVETINLINQRRTAMGLQTLRTQSSLTTAARRLSFDIGPLGLCQHNGTDGSTPWSRMTDAGYTGAPIGEVVGCGYPSSLDVVNDWWNSPAHYSILTNATANDIGCGWWINSSGYGWATCDLGQSP